MVWKELLQDIRRELFKRLPKVDEDGCDVRLVGKEIERQELVFVWNSDQADQSKQLTAAKKNNDKGHLKPTQLS